MKKNTFLIAVLLVAISMVGSSFITKKSFDLSSYSTEGLELDYNVPTESELTLELVPVTPKFNLFLGKTYLGFKEALGFKESRNNYYVTNPYGYLGKYQFAKSTLHMIGIKNSDNFLNDTRQQEAAFLAYTSMNKWVLRRDIKRYTGKTVGGVKVTESGILAAAHLVGAGNVKKYLRTSGVYAFEDGNGVSVRYYLRKFSGYDTSHIVPNRRPKVI